MKKKSIKWFGFFLENPLSNNNNLKAHRQVVALVDKQGRSLRWKPDHILDLDNLAAYEDKPSCKRVANFYKLPYQLVD